MKNCGVKNGDVLSLMLLLLESYLFCCDCC